MTTRPINKCAAKACPMVGYWAEGACCPMHSTDPPPRRPDVLEDWTETER